MDFLERLNDSINSVSGLPIKCKLGYLSPAESLCLYPIPGSKIISQYYDEAKDQQLNYEVAMKSDDQQKVNTTLWLISNHLEELSELISLDGSFDFESIEITNKPFINALDDKKNYIFMLDIQAKITTYHIKGE